MRAGRRDVPLTHPDKVLFPDDAIAKADLAAYYRDVAPRMVGLVRDRPVSLQRFNDGIAKQGFFQKNVERGAPDWVKRVRWARRAARCGTCSPTTRRRSCGWPTRTASPRTCGSRAPTGSNARTG